MSTAYSHVWRAADIDFPCNLTGREEPDSNGQVYVEIAREDDRTFVPKEQLLSFASWKAEQSKAAAKTPNQRASLKSSPGASSGDPQERTPMDAADAATEHLKAGPIEVTWP